MTGSCSGVHSAIARSSPRAIGARRNPAIAWPWLSDLPTSINSTSGPRWTTARERPASRTRSRQRSCHIPYPDMPATSREPLVDQNGVSPSPNWNRRRTSSRTAADLPTPTGPTRSTLRGRRPVSDSASRPTTASRPSATATGPAARSVATSGSTGRASTSPRAAACAACRGLGISATNLRRSTRTTSPRCTWTSLGSAIAFSRRSVERAWIGKSRSRSSRRAPRTSIPRAGTVAIDPPSPRSQRTAARRSATASRQAVNRSAGSIVSATSPTSAASIARRRYRSRGSSASTIRRASSASASRTASGSSPSLETSGNPGASARINPSSSSRRMAISVNSNFGIAPALDARPLAAGGPRQREPNGDGQVRVIANRVRRRNGCPGRPSQDTSRPEGRVMPLLVGGEVRACAVTTFPQGPVHL